MPHSLCLQLCHTSPVADQCPPRCLLAPIVLRAGILQNIICIIPLAPGASCAALLSLQSQSRPCHVALTKREPMLQAEVLSSMRGKLAGKPGTYAILVAVPAEPGPDSDPIGVVEVYQECSQETAQRVGASSHEEGCGWLASMAIAQSRRRQGVGRALIQAAEDAVKAWGYQRTALHVFADNVAAVKMYEACGFEQIESTPFHWMQWLRARDKVLMHRWHGL